MTEEKGMMKVHSNKFQRAKRACSQGSIPERSPLGVVNHARPLPTSSTTKRIKQAVGKEHGEPWEPIGFKKLQKPLSKNTVHSVLRDYQ